MHDRYVGELLKGEFSDATREQFISLVERLHDRERIDGVILGATELPLLPTSPEIAGLPALDTTARHVAAIVHRLRPGLSEATRITGTRLAARNRLADFRLRGELACSTASRRRTCPALT